MTMTCAHTGDHHDPECVWETPSTPPKAWCCFIPCDADADYSVVHGPGVDDYTHGCASHAGHLIPDGTEARLIPIGWG